MKTDFIHLHVHTQYSLLDGAIRIPDLLSKCKEFGMKSVAITDHGAMYGVLDFYIRAKREGIKPIIGCEFYLSPEHRTDQEKEPFHIVLLAMNLTGYKNMMKMASIAQFEDFFHKSCINMKTLIAHNEGLIALTACQRGHIPWLIGQNNMAGDREKAKEFHQIFGDRLYFELQENGLPEQILANQGMKQLAAELGIKTVATNNCHYLNKDEACVHEVLLCIQSNRTIKDPKRSRRLSDEFYFKSAAEMKKCCRHTPEAIAATVEIAERCNLEIALGENHFPDFQVPEGETMATVFTATCHDGLLERFTAMRKAGTFNPPMKDDYKKRLTYEIDTIIAMGLHGFFLIFADLINWAKEHDISLNAGYGTGACSLVAYCLRLTNIDPIHYGLFFERFLNIKRKNRPLFGVYCCQKHRRKVLQYLRNKYGANNVGQVLTFDVMDAHKTIQDVGKVMGIPGNELKKIIGLISPDIWRGRIERSIVEEPRLQDAINKDPQIAKLLHVAQSLERNNRNISSSATEVILAPQPLEEFLPVCKIQAGKILTQYDDRWLHQLGLFTFQLCGFKSLSIIEKTLKCIKEDCGIDLDLETIPLDNLKTFDLICNGDTKWVFDLESSKIRQLLTKLAPTRFSDLVALLALYRPGPLESGMMDNFIEAKHGCAIATYLPPQVTSVLEETYGIIVFQEQIVQITQILANYSLIDADVLRVAMGTHKEKVLKQEKLRFVAGALHNGLSKTRATYLFNLMERTAGFLTPKSAIVTRALISYQTAYLKANYPDQFMSSTTFSQQKDIG